MAEPLLDTSSLRALQLLLETRSVTAAARRAGTTQPAMSRTLSRLRSALGDPLLVPVGGRFEPTARALELKSRVEVALAAVRDVATPAAPFSPKEERGEVRLASTDYGIVTVVLPWLARLRVEAPELTVRVQLATPDSIGALARGDLDLAIAPRVPLEGMDQFVTRPLFTDRFVCALRPRHPALDQRLTLRRYLALGHVAISSGRPGLSSVARALHDQGHTRTVTLTVPTFLAAVAMVRGSDLCATLPRRLVEADGSLAHRPLPFAVEALSLHLTWHPRATRDPRHRWLREHLAASVP